MSGSPRWSAGLGFAVVVAASLGAPGCRADASLREGLVADAIASEEASSPRSSHVASPTPGTFGDAAEPVIAKLIVGITPLPPVEVMLASPPPIAPPVRSPCDAFAIRYDAASLDDACRAESAKRVAPLGPLLEATHAQHAGQPPSLRTTDPAVTLPRTRAVFMALRDLDIEARIALASGRGAEVLAGCPDRLALVRDLTWGALLLSDVTGQTSLGQVLATCALAVDGAAPDARRKLAGAMERVGKGMPPFLVLARREQALMQARAWGDELDDGERARVPETLRREIAPSEATVDDWRAFRDHARETDAALGAPTAEERLRRVTALDATAGDTAPQWARYLSLHDRHLAAIDAFVWALRATADELDGKPAAAIPTELAPFTKLERAADATTVTVTLEDDPPRSLALRFPKPPPAIPGPDPGARSP